MMQPALPESEIRQSKQDEVSLFETKYHRDVYNFQGLQQRTSPTTGDKRPPDDCSNEYTFFTEQILCLKCLCPARRRTKEIGTCCC